MSRRADAYAEQDVDVDLVPFIEDMADAYAWADLVVCRSGALTVAELCAVGLPALFVPYPAAVDDHQTANARPMADAGAAVIIDESMLSSDVLAEQLRDWLASRDELQKERKRRAAWRSRQRCSASPSCACNKRESQHDQANATNPLCALCRHRRLRHVRYRRSDVEPGLQGAGLGPEAEQTDTAPCRAGRHHLHRPRRGNIDNADAVVVSSAVDETNAEVSRHASS